MVDALPEYRAVFEALYSEVKGEEKA